MGVQSVHRGGSCPFTWEKTVWMAVRCYWNWVSKTVSQAQRWVREREDEWAKDDLDQRTASRKDTEKLQELITWDHTPSVSRWPDIEYFYKILRRVMARKRRYGFLATFSSLQNGTRQNNLPNDAWKVLWCLSYEHTKRYLISHPR